MKYFLIFAIAMFFFSLVIGSGWAILTIVRDTLLGLQARDWPHTTGRVLSVVSERNWTSESYSRVIRVRYAYSVGGLDYEGYTIHPTYRSSEVEQAHRGVESLLRSARQVRVYYDGSQPSRSMLSVGFYSGTLTYLFIYLVLFGSGIGALFALWFGVMGDWDFARGITVVR